MKYSQFLIVILVLFEFTAPFSTAELWQYTDEKGLVHYVTDFKQIPKSGLKTATELDDNGQKLSSVPIAKYAVSENKKRIEIYVTSWCPHCKKLRATLNARKIPYTAYDIDKSKAAKSRMEKLGANSVPLIIIDKQIIRGYNSTSIELALERYEKDS